MSLLQGVWVYPLAAKPGGCLGVSLQPSECPSAEAPPLSWDVGVPALLESLADEKEHVLALVQT